jgi:hypothetical protein
MHHPHTADAVTIVIFDASQTTTLVSSNTTSDTISSEGYLFTYTRDKLFTGGTTNIIGRPVRVPWPAGLEAQYVTTTTNKVTIMGGCVTAFAVRSSGLLKEADGPF